MKIKVQTCYFTRFLLLLALLLSSAGYHSFAQSSLSGPVLLPDSMRQTPPGEAEYLSFAAEEDSLNAERINYFIQSVAADTSDTTQVEKMVTIRIGGKEGWRMVSAPTQPLTFSELLHSVWTQGLPGSDDPIATVPSILVWDEANGGFTSKPSAMSDMIKAGRGYITYFFEDDNPSQNGVQGGFPKEIKLREKQDYELVPVKVTATDENDNKRIDSHEGWNLLANPFKETLSVGKVISAFQATGDSLNQYVYVWDGEKGGGNAGFRPLGVNEEIAPFQAFFIKYAGEREVSATVELRKEELLNSTNSSPRQEDETAFSLILQLSDGELYDEYELNFSERGSILQNGLDALKLFSMDRKSMNIYGRKGQSRIGRNFIPPELTSPVEIPIGVDSNSKEELMISWKNLEDLPHEWTVTLLDRQRNTETDLRTNREYHFVHKHEVNQQVIPSRVERPDIIRKNKEGEGRKERFLLAIRPGHGKVATEQNPESIKLKPNYPNPFNQETVISYEINEETEVTLSIWNMIGQKVATLVDDQVEAGSHEERWSAPEMPSGMYIARLEVGNQVFTRKMTLIK